MALRFSVSPYELNVNESASVSEGPRPVWEEQLNGDLLPVLIMCRLGSVSFQTFIQLAVKTKGGGGVACIVSLSALCQKMKRFSTFTL